MGSIAPYEIASGRRYRVRWYDPDGKPVEKNGIKTKREAELFLASIEVSKATGEYVDARAARVTVGELAVEWLANKRGSQKPSTYRGTELAWRRYVQPRWGAARIGTVRPTEVKAWVRQLGDGTAMTDTSGGPIPAEGATPKSATHVGRALTILTGIMDDAVADGRLVKNPARGMNNLPRKTPKRERRYLRHGEVARLVDALDGAPNRQMVVLTLAYTGIRWSEMRALRVRDVNVLRRRLEVRRNAVKVGGVTRLGTPKSHEARSVPFPAFLGERLVQQFDGKGPDDLVFPGSDGGFMHAPNTTTGSQSWWITALREAGIERMTLHDLRHTAASLAISAGANVKAVQRMLGHASAAMTLDVYADLFEDDLDGVAERLDADATKAGMGRLWGDSPRAV